MKLDWKDSTSYVPLLFQSLDGLIGLDADEDGPDDWGIFNENKVDVMGNPLELVERQESDF